MPPAGPRFENRYRHLVAGVVRIRRWCSSSWDITDETSSPSIFVSGGKHCHAPARVEDCRAQTYPARSITMIVPFAPGGLADLIGRILAEGMRASLGQSVIIENVGGAAGNIGTGRVARAAPDGYTLVLGIWNTHVANGAIYALQYDVVKDFEPIALLADAPLVLVARKALPANDLKEFIAWLKLNPAAIRTLWRDRLIRRSSTRRRRCRTCAPAASRPSSSRPKTGWR